MEGALTVTAEGNSSPRRIRSGVRGWPSRDSQDVSALGRGTAFLGIDGETIELTLGPDEIIKVETGALAGEIYPYLPISRQK